MTRLSFFLGFVVLLVAVPSGSLTAQQEFSIKPDDRLRISWSLPEWEGRTYRIPTAHGDLTVGPEHPSIGFLDKLEADTLFLRSELGADVDIVDGQVVELTQSDLILDIPRVSITGIEESRGKKEGNTRKGALIGAAIGAGVGLALYAAAGDPPAGWQIVVPMAVYGGLGAGIGAVVGRGGPEEWEPLYSERRLAGRPAEVAPARAH